MGTKQHALLLLLFAAATSTAAQAEPYARISWSCAMTSPSGTHFQLAGDVDNLPLSGTYPLIGQGRVNVDLTDRFLGSYDVWMGDKQFELVFYGTEREGYKPSIALRLPRREYAAQGGGMAIITTLNDAGHGGVNYSDYVGVGYCTADWSDFEKMKAGE